MNRSISILGALALSLTMFACSGGVGHGARPAPGPEAFGLTEESATVKTANGAQAAPGPEAFPGHEAPQLAKGGVSPAPAPQANVQEASR